MTVKFSLKPGSRKWHLLNVQQVIPIKDLQLDAKVSESDDDEGHTMTTEFNSENNIDYSSWTDSKVF